MTRNKCPTCHKPADVVKTIILNHKIYTGCENCLDSSIHESNGAAKFNREYQKKEYRRELTQPNQRRDFIKAYPDKAKEYYNEDTLRKYG